jgi:hypothetical protein
VSQHCIHIELFEFLEVSLGHFDDKSAQLVLSL